MKNLAKVVMSLAVVMFISSTVFAIDPPTDQTGTVTLTVQKYLEFDLGTTGDLTFEFNKLTANNPAAQPTTVYVRSNIDWEASVEATASDLVGVTDLGIGVLELDGSPMVLNSAITKTGSLTNTVDFSYDFNITGNPIPGEYITNLTYSVAEE